MSEKLGVENLSKLAKSVAVCATAIADKSGIFSILGTLIGLASVDWVKVKDEAKDLSSEERLVIEKELSDNFVPSNKAVDLGFDKFLELGEKSVAVVLKGVSAGEEVFETVKSLVAEWKQLLGVSA